VTVGPARERLRRIAAQRGLRVDYPDAVMREVEARAADPGIDDPALDDLTGEPFVTIDYADSRDLDQALLIERAGAGYTVHYALADAAHFVPPGSALFAEALARGVTYYLPGFNLPMLPAALSEDLVSLLEGVDRRALVFSIDLDQRGAVAGTRVRRARIRSRAKLTYDGVQAYHDDATSSPLAGRALGDTLDLLAEVGRLRIALAGERDVVRYDRVSADLHLDGDGRLAIRGQARNDVQAWNEQISLLCNVEGALLLERAGTAGIYRVHPPPGDDRLERLRQQIERLVVALALDAETWCWHRDRESLADYIERLPSGRLATALQRQAMLINVSSYYATESGPHYGIGAASYSRFSAPMREVVGIAAHHLANGGGGFDAAALAQVVAAGNRGRELQKQVDKDTARVAIDQLFAADLAMAAGARPARRGTVMGAGSAKLYVQLDDPPIEVKVYAEALAGLGFRYQVADHGFAATLSGPAGPRTVRVGEAVDLIVRDYDRDGGRWVLAPG
jgi:ribonuclease R